MCIHSQAQDMSTSAWRILLPVQLHTTFTHSLELLPKVDSLLPEAFCQGMARFQVACWTAQTLSAPPQQSSSWGYDSEPFYQQE